MPLLPNTISLMRSLGIEVETLRREHYSLSPRNGNIPVGGAHMDSFFRMEAIEGMLTALRKKETLEESIFLGIERCLYAILTWNDKREYQVHRSTDWVEDYLRNLVRRFS